MYLASILLLLLLVAPGGYAQTGDTEFEAGVSALNAKKFRQKAQAIEALTQLRHPRIEAVLGSMLAGNLYYRKSDRKVFITLPDGKQRLLIDPLSGEKIGSVAKGQLKKIGVNNTLRTQLRSALAKLKLTHPDPQVRLAAVRQIVDKPDAENTELLIKTAAGETDAEVLQWLQTGIALGNLSNPDTDRRLAAIASLSDELSDTARNRINTLAQDDPQPRVRAAATKALSRIDTTRAHYARVETLFFGLSLGSVLFLAAVGLAITFGVMGVINMAHGELIMLGAYTTYLVQLALPGAIEYSLLLAIPLAFIVSGLFGIAIERGVIRFLYGRPLETLLATFGISLILQQLVRTMISAQNVPVINPEWMSGSWQLNSVLSLTYNRLYIFIFSLMVFFALVLVFKRTALGLEVRAVAQNRDMAKAMGIHTERVDALSFGLGAGIAGVAGVALSQLTNVGPNLGQTYIVDSFLVVVFGGVGNILGTLLGAMGLGVLNKFLEPAYGAVLAKILVLIGIILFIQKRPRGLFPQKGRAVDY